MRIYSDIGYGNGTVLVQPGAEHPEVVEFMNATTRYAPRGFEHIGSEFAGPVVVRVQFKNGAADVSKTLGRYMIRHGLASRW